MALPRGTCCLRLRGEMLELFALAFLALTLLVVASAGLLALKVVLWIVLLPVRLFFALLFGLLFLPVLLLKALLGTVAMIVVGPFLVLTLLAGAAIAFVALLVPLLPLLAIGLVIWLVVSATERPVVAS
ncbi:MAG: hypothetical protein H0T05_04025 [Acidobacteria bacterium]|nr:hypothetical protein [Acidobacteriota bacterium]